jgi:uncharacterized SAM-binding protein YcdF (DUF218 family)
VRQRFLHFSQSSLRQYTRFCRLLVITIISIWAMAVGWQLISATRIPVDGYLVLGGSIRREMFMAEQAAKQGITNHPILISAGSQDPCIRLLFEQAQASLDNVWLEDCAESTFGNFFFSLPWLKKQGVRHVALVSSGTHLARALWMGRIILGSHGIWVTPIDVPEVGRPGNEETRLKSVLDITRSLLWAVASQGYQPKCDRITPLNQVDLKLWRNIGFKCEHQAGIEGS